MGDDDLRFGQIALRMGLMTDEQVDLCLRAQQSNPKNKLGSVCVALGVLSPDQVLSVLKTQAEGVRLRRAHEPSRARVATQAPPPEQATHASIAAPAPAHVTQAHTTQSGAAAQSGTAAPVHATQSGTAAPVHATQSGTAAPVHATQSGTAAPVHATQSGTAVHASVVASARGLDAHGSPTEGTAPTSRAADMLPPPVADPRLVRLLSAARKRGASDLHVVANRKVALRRHGELSQHGEPLSPEDVQQMLYSVMAPLRLRQLEQAGYSDFAVDVEGAGRLRVNVGTQATGLKGCFRFVMGDPPTLRELGLPSELERVLEFHQGLAVVSGPNGMGKTTTLAALVAMINKTKPVHIITVEDPVEVVYPVGKAVVSQREVGVHTKSFARALKAALREDPDVIVIGELRDLETVEIALEAAETGHLVIATMSTRSGAKTIDRLIDMFPPDQQTPVRASLAGGLKIVVSQRLVPTKDGKGQVPVAEVISGGIQLALLIRDAKLLQLPSLMQRGKALGMLQFDESLLRLVASGKISEETARAHAEHRGNVDSRLRELAGGGGGPDVDAWAPAEEEEDPWANPENQEPEPEVPQEPQVAPWDLVSPVAPDQVKRGIFRKRGP